MNSELKALSLHRLNLFQMNKQFLLAALWLSPLGLYAHKANGIGAVTWKNEHYNADEL